MQNIVRRVHGFPKIDITERGGDVVVHLSENKYLRYYLIKTSSFHVQVFNYSFPACLCKFSFKEVEIISQLDRRLSNMCMMHFSGLLF